MNRYAQAVTPGELVRAVRRRRGLTQAELARRAGPHSRSSPPTSAATATRPWARSSGSSPPVASASTSTHRCRHPICHPPRPRGARATTPRCALDRRRRTGAKAPPASRRAPTRLVVTALTLAERVLALDQALAAIPHAVGGGLALAHDAEPRATIDIDLNLFVPAERFADVATPLVALGAPRRRRRGRRVRATRRAGAGVVEATPRRPVVRLRPVP
jgi:hypothetical protein